MKTATLSIKVAVIGLLLSLSVIPAPAQTKQKKSQSTKPKQPMQQPTPVKTQSAYELSKASELSKTSRRVFKRMLIPRTPWRPFSRAYVPPPPAPAPPLATPTTTTQQIILQTSPPPAPSVLRRPPRLFTMSLHFAPTIAINTADGVRQFAGFQPNGFGIRYSIGPTVDYFFFRDRYAFSTGLWFTVRRSGFQMPGSFGQSRFTPGLPDQKSVYNLQYLQVPMLLKLFANDLAPGIHLYIQTGIIISARTLEIPLDKTRNGLYQFAEITGKYQDQYRVTDADWLLGAGLQYQISEYSALNFGLSYQRGLTSVAIADDLDSRMRTLSIDLGFKF